MNDLPALLPILILVIVFYFFIIRPQGKRRREFMEMQQKTSVGSRIMLTSGIFGTVTGLEDENMTVEIAPGVEVEVHRNVVAKIVNATESDDTDSASGAIDDRWNDDESGKA